MLKRIVLNGDDYGLTDGVCRAILQLLDCGAISNTTVMMLADGAPDRILRFEPSRISGRAGVHLQLSGGHPLSNARVSSVVDAATGQFLPRERIETADPADIAHEWRLQIEKFIKCVGAGPTHIDTHMGFHRVPAITPIYLDLASQYGIPVRGGEEPFTDTLRSKGIRGTTLFVRGWSGQQKGTKDLKTKLAQLSEAMHEDDVIEVTVHPGFPDASLRSVSTLNDAREEDMRNVLDLQQEGWLTSHGLTQVSFPTLAER